MLSTRYLSSSSLNMEHNFNLNEYPSGMELSLDLNIPANMDQLTGNIFYAFYAFEMYG